MVPASHPESLWQAYVWFFLDATKSMEKSSGSDNGSISVREKWPKPRKIRPDDLDLSINVNFLGQSRSNADGET